jgi:two-component system, chemotaxis family, protein-glutamate methylesterase/glutaminase
VIKVLVVDDSALLRRLLDGVLRNAGGFEVALARNGREALAQLHVFHPDVVTLDIEMPGMDGLACLDRIMVERPCPVVMVSALAEAGAVATLEAMALGAVDFIAKPGGAISLEMADFAPLLLEKIRTAAGAKLRRSHRLAERIRAQLADRLAVHGAVVDRPAAPPRQSAGRTQAHAPSATAESCLLIGASTGGPPALEAVLSQLPADLPCAVLVAQHMPAAFTGPLARRLSGLCALEVCEVVEPLTLAAGRVHIARGGADAVVSRRSGSPIIRPVPAAPALHWHPSVDRLVDSALEYFEPNRLIGVLLTGMGNDGAAAMTRLRAAGGRTLAEAEESAVVWGMPGALVQAGGAEIVAPLDEIGDRVRSLVEAL